jgi:hypothetical protein
MGERIGERRDEMNCNDIQGRDGLWPICAGLARPHPEERCEAMRLEGRKSGLPDLRSQVADLG